MKEWNKMRYNWALNDAKRDAGLTEPEGIDRCMNIDYSRTDSICIKTPLPSEYDNINSVSEENCHLMDIYYPAFVHAPYPVIVVIHGGGWFYGNKQLYRYYAMDLAGRGFAVVCMNYRLAPEYTYPCAIQDVCDCMVYLDMHRDELKLDMHRLFLTGDSAGGQLTSQYAVLATNEIYRKRFYAADLDKKNIILPVPTAVALNCGVYDMANNRDDNLLDWYVQQETDFERETLYSVLDYVNGDFPPTYIMCSVNDPLMCKTEPMRQKLVEHNIKHVYVEYGKEHPESGHVFHLDMNNEEGKRCNNEECSFFLSVL